MTRSKKNAALLIPAVGSPVSFWRYITHRDTPKGPKLALLAAMLYVLLPVDLIPDVAPMIGWLDDVGFASLAVGYVARQFARQTEAAAVPVVESTAS